MKKKDYYGGETIMKLLSKIAVSIIAVLFSVSAFAKDVTILVAGSKTGTFNYTSQLLAKDSASNTLGSVSINIVAPGGACKALELLPEYVNKTPVWIILESRYTASVKSSAKKCNLPNEANGISIFSQVESSYFVGQIGMSTADLTSKPLKIGYSKNYTIIQDFHKRLVEATGQPHQFVGYDGSGSLQKGFLAGEIDIAVINEIRGGKLALKKQGTVLYTSYRDATNYPSITEIDSQLDRKNIISWYLFGADKDTIAELKTTIESNYKTKKGEWSAYVHGSNATLFFGDDQPSFNQDVDSWLQK